MKKASHRWLAILFLASALTAAAQYSVPWHKVAGGGGTSAGGQYSISGTIGQPDASGPMNGGNYSVTGGFWSLINVVQTPGLPSLIITHSGNNIVVYWPNTGNPILQQNTDLAVKNGWTTSAYNITVANGTNSITITSPTGNLFFRLKSP